MSLSRLENPQLHRLWCPRPRSPTVALLPDLCQGAECQGWRPHSGPMVTVVPLCSPPLWLRKRKKNKKKNARSCPADLLLESVQDITLNRTMPPLPPSAPVIRPEWHTSREESSVSLRTLWLRFNSNSKPHAALRSFQPTILLHSMKLPFSSAQKLS